MHTQIVYNLSSTYKQTNILNRIHQLTLIKKRWICSPKRNHTFNGCQLILNNSLTTILKDTRHFLS